MTDERTAPGDGEGLETHKYRVERMSDPEGKHAGCWYFVLDPHHDPHALVALRQYAYSVRADNPALARDLHAVADRYGPGTSWGIQRSDGRIVTPSDGQRWEHSQAVDALSFARAFTDDPGIRLVFRVKDDGAWWAVP